MNEPHWDYLIQGHLDDTLTEAERAEFDALVLQSAAARRRFWELAEIHGLARDAARIAWGHADASADQADAFPSGLNRPAPNWWTRFITRPLMPLAAGLAIGVLCTSVLWAYVGPSVGKVITLLQDNFEAGPAPLVTGVPIATGRWSGDYSEVVGEQQGVKPETGKKMLRFLSADYEGKPNPGGYSADLFRLIDLRPFRREFSDGGAVVQLSAAFDAIALSADEKYECDVCIYALDADMATDGSMRIQNRLFTGSLAMARSSRNVLDRDPATWQHMACELRLPANTDFLMIRIGVVHASHMPGAFAGHYADDVRVTMARRAPLP
jgi:hypothetical protein